MIDSFQKHFYIAASGKPTIFLFSKIVQNSNAFENVKKYFFIFVIKSTVVLKIEDLVLSKLAVFFFRHFIELLTLELNCYDFLNFSTSVKVQ